MTPTELQNSIEANTAAITELSSAVGNLVSRFVEPTARQVTANTERLDRIEGLLDRHAQAIVEVDLKLDRIAEQQAIGDQRLGLILTQVAEQQAANAQQIATNAEELTRSESLNRDNQQSLQILIEEGRAERTQVETLRQDTQQSLQILIEEGRADRAQVETLRQDTQQSLQILVEEGRAARQSQREVLRAVLSNAQRIDQLEQRVS